MKRKIKIEGAGENVLVMVPLPSGRDTRFVLNPTEAVALYLALSDYLFEEGKK